MTIFRCRYFYTSIDSLDVNGIETGFMSIYHNNKLVLFQDSEGYDDAKIGFGEDWNLHDII